MTTAELEEHIKILRSEIKLKELKIKELKKQIFENDYKKISWDDFEKWLLENDKGHYLDNPAISNGYHYDYCKIDNGQLRVGAYFHNDHFPRGKDLHVAFHIPYGKL